MQLIKSIQIIIYLLSSFFTTLIPQNTYHQVSTFLTDIYLIKLIYLSSSDRLQRFNLVYDKLRNYWAALPVFFPILKFVLRKLIADVLLGRKVFLLYWRFGKVFVPNLTLSFQFFLSLYRIFVALLGLFFQNLLGWFFQFLLDWFQKLFIVRFHPIAR